MAAGAVQVRVSGYGRGAPPPPPEMACLQAAPVLLVKDRSGGDQRIRTDLVSNTHHLLRFAELNEWPGARGQASVELQRSGRWNPAGLKNGPQARRPLRSSRSEALTRVHARAFAFASRTGALVATLTAVAADQFVNGGSLVTCPLPGTGKLPPARAAVIAFSARVTARWRSQ